MPLSTTEEQADFEAMKTQLANLQTAVNGLQTAVAPIPQILSIVEEIQKSLE